MKDNLSSQYIGMKLWIEKGAMLIMKIIKKKYPRRTRINKRSTSEI